MFKWTTLRMVIKLLLWSNAEFYTCVPSAFLICLGCIFLTVLNVIWLSSMTRIKPSLLVCRENLTRTHVLNSSAPEQNGRHFTDDISRYLFVNENFCILIKTSLNRRHVIIWTNADPIHWRIYATLGVRWVNFIKLRLKSWYCSNAICMFYILQYIFVINNHVESINPR